MELRLKTRNERSKQHGVFDRSWVVAKTAQWSLSYESFFTHHFSGQVQQSVHCVCVSVGAITFGPNDLWTTCMASGSCWPISVKFEGQGHRSKFRFIGWKSVVFFGYRYTIWHFMDARCDVPVTFSFFSSFLCANVVSVTSSEVFTHTVIKTKLTTDMSQVSSLPHISLYISCLSRSQEKLFFYSVEAKCFPIFFTRTKKF